MPRKLVITGGSGFIGTNLVQMARDRGDAVVNIDLRPPQVEAQRACWREGDLMDAGALRALIADADPDAIINLAAVADIALRAAAMPANTQGLRHVIEAARALPTKPQLIHASTQLVVKPGYLPAHPRDFAPYTEYGQSKAESEEILWEEAGDLRWTIVRPSTIWGPWHATFGGSIWKYLNRRWYMLPTGMDPVRSYGYVANVCAQLLAVVDAPTAAVDHKIFYVGDAPEPSSKWLDGFSRALTGHATRRIPGSALRVLATLGEWSNAVGGPSPINRGRLYRMTTDYPVPMEETFRVLGRGNVDSASGIAATVAWLRERHPDEYRR